VEFAWGVASDAQTPAAGLNYNLRVGTTPGGSQIVSPQSGTNGYRRLIALGNAGPSLAARLGSLKPGSNYFWSVQAVDTAFAGSAFATEGSFTALGDPAQNVSIVSETGGVMRVTWRGTPGSIYRVELSSDLITWTPTNTPTAAASTGLFEYFEIPASDVAQRFYRAARP